MCLPIGILKCIVQLEAWIVMLGGIAAFIFTVVMQINYSLMLATNEGESWMLFGQGMLTAFWIFSSYIIINGIIGIVGGNKKNACLLLVFNIGNIIILLAFIILTVIGYVMANAVIPFEDPQKCLDDRSELLTLNTESEELLCSAECPCFYNLSVPLPGTLHFASNTETDRVFLNVKQPTRVQDCVIFQKTQNTTVKYFSNYLGEIQKRTGCTGWCEPYVVKVFYDINSPVDNTTLTCQPLIIQKLSDMGQLMGDIAVGVTALMLTLIVLTGCLCFHPAKQNEPDFYKRMAHYE